LLLALVVFLRVLFLNTAIQGDDVYYLAGAEHALVDPLHPSHAKYFFLGELVDMRGHSHPPLNSWILGGLLAVIGSARTVPLHAAYLVFSLMAVWAAWEIARRFTDHPATAVLLLVVTPAFVVNGTSIEADLPFLAFWLAAVACLFRALDWRSLWWLATSSAAAALAGLTAYQGVLLTPLLGWMVWRSKPGWRAAWVAAFAAPIALASYQLFEFMTAGQWPIAVLAGYLSSRGFQTAGLKMRNAAALTAHLGFVSFPVLVWWALRGRLRWQWVAAGAVAAAGAAVIDPHPLFWIPFATGVLALLFCLLSVGIAEERFAAVWVLGFFAASLGIFFAGSVRYLLPAVFPLAILISRHVRGPVLISGMVLQLLLSVLLALVNAQHWNAYRAFASGLEGKIAGQRVWVNSEWGLRHYMEELGARVPGRGETIRPGDIVVSSRLAIPVPLRTGPGSFVPVAKADVTSRIPLRLIALDTMSAYSVVGRGLRPFDISSGLIDTIQAERFEGNAVRESVWTPNNASVAGQALSGLSGDGWTADTATVVVRVPEQAGPVFAQFGVTPQGAPQLVRLLLDGKPIAEQRYSSAGAYSLSAPMPAYAGETAQITVEVDRTFRVPGDQRELGVLLTAVGIKKAE
jgi:4-amino-4-deoxy-L-arabinose transferase-like glycosyltransferase